MAQFPMGWVMQRFPLGKALGTCVILWGGVVLLHAACNNYWQLAIVRVLLGWFESVITPGFLMLTVSWYLRKEQTLRQCLYYAMSESEPMWQPLLTDVRHILCSCVRYRHLLSGSQCPTKRRTGSMARHREYSIIPLMAEPLPGRSHSRYGHHHPVRGRYAGRSVVAVQTRKAHGARSHRVQCHWWSRQETMEMGTGPRVLPRPAVLPRHAVL